MWGLLAEVSSSVWLMVILGLLECGGVKLSVRFVLYGEPGDSGLRKMAAEFDSSAMSTFYT